MPDMAHRRKGGTSHELPRRLAWGIVGIDWKGGDGFSYGGDGKWLEAESKKKRAGLRLFSSD